MSTADQNPPAKPGADLLELAAARVLGELPDCDIVHVTLRGGVARVMHDGKPTMFKLTTCSVDWKKRWARVFGWNPARIASQTAAALEAAGIPVCPIDRHGQIKLPGVPKAVWSVGPWFDDAPALRKVRKQIQGDKQWPEDGRVIRLFESALKLARRMHDAGFVHGDFHGGNMLVVGDELRLVDLESIRQKRPDTKARAKDLEKFLENFLEQQHAEKQVKEALAIYAPDDKTLQQAILQHPRVQALIERISRGQRKKRPKKT
jgi:hypothetical protein